jgi:hypothetical protein
VLPLVMSAATVMRLRSRLGNSVRSQTSPRENVISQGDELRREVADRPLGGGQAFRVGHVFSVLNDHVHYACLYITRLASLVMYQLALVTDCLTQRVTATDGSYTSHW